MREITGLVAKRAVSFDQFRVNFTLVKIRLVSHISLHFFIFKIKYFDTSAFQIKKFFKINVKF